MRETARKDNSTLHVRLVDIVDVIKCVV